MRSNYLLSSKKSSPDLEKRLSDAQKKLNLLLKDLVNIGIENFSERSPKEKGQSRGFITSDENSAYVVKQGELSFNNNVAFNRSSAAEKRDLMAEYIFSPLYKRILKDRAPFISLSSSKGEQSNLLYLKSKMLNNFESIRDIKASKYFEIDYYKIRKYK